MTSQPRQQHQGATIRKRIRSWVELLAGVLGSAVLALVVVGGVVALAQHVAQSASVPVTIVQIEPATWHVGKHDESGEAITYTFTVGGKTYLDREKRTWIDVAAAHPKVCYDPANPNRHFLAQDAYTCAGLNPFQDYGQFFSSRDGTK